jgi:hypothetical protein
VNLETVERLKFPLRLGLSILVIARGQIIKMQNHAIPSGGVSTLVDAVEPLILRGLKFEVDIPGEPSERPVDSNGTLRLQNAAQTRDISR